MAAVDPSAGAEVERRILELLTAGGCRFDTLDHPPVASAAEAAAARGTPLAIGAKTILFKIDHDFRLLALPADCRLRSRRLRVELGARRTRFATAEELASLTGLEPGAVPPFGPPVLPFPLLADPALLSRPRIAFTAGRRERSILLATADWERVAGPALVAFAG